MVLDNNEDRKGFSGFLDLASEVSGMDEPIKPEPKAKATPSSSKEPSQPQREATRSKPERKNTSSPSPIETVSPGKSGGGSGGKWFLGIIGAIFMIWFINNDGQSNKQPSHAPSSSSQSYSYTQSTPAPTVQTPGATQSTGLQYTKPSVGNNNMLSVPEIRWCIREDIRIEAMRNIPVTNNGIDGFNRLVSDYNLRCASFRYREGTLQRAERDVGAYKNQIIADARSYARTLDASNSVSSSTSSRNSTSLLIHEAQNLLNNLGYSPGLADGIYGPRTASAVRSFQRDMNMIQDGQINQQLIERLRRALGR